MKLLQKENYQLSNFPTFTAYAKVWNFDATELDSGKYNVKCLINLFSSQDSAKNNDGTSFKQTDFYLYDVENTNLNADYFTSAALAQEEYGDWTEIDV